MEYYKYGFECPDISKLNTIEQKNEVFNKLLNQFEKELKEWVYKKNTYEENKDISLSPGFKKIPLPKSFNNPLSDSIMKFIIEENC